MNHDLAAWTADLPEKYMAHKPTHEWNTRVVEASPINGPPKKEEKEEKPEKADDKPEATKPVKEAKA